VSARSSSATSSPPARRGLLAGMGAPRPEAMPTIPRAFSRGLAAAWSSPVVVGGLLTWLLIEWLLIVALGYPGPAALLAYVSAPAPLSTTTDISFSTGILGVQRGLPLAFAAGAVHALWSSILVGLTMETVESGRATRWGAIRGLRAFPVSFALHVIGVGVLFASEIVAGLGGGGLAFFLRVAVLVVAVWAFAFAPVIAIAERRRLMDCLGRSIRAARLPGSGNLSFAAIYAVPVFATLLGTFLGSVPGSLLGVAPPPLAWVFIVVMNLLHAAVLGALAMRYLAVAGEVPDAPARAASARSERDRKTRSAPTKGRRPPPRRR
jgi:hypothetical protein